jgi:hypothetical protein
VPAPCNAAAVCRIHEQEGKDGLFFEKKKQKTFFELGRLVSLPEAQFRKGFCAAFFKKRLLP